MPMSKPVHFLQILCCAIFISMLAACATDSMQKPLLTNLQGLGKKQVLQMQTQIIRARETYSLDLVVDISKEKVIIVGSSLGIRIFTLSYDGVNIAEGAGSGLPFYIPNDLIVDDLMLILTSNQALKDNLPADCSLVIAGDLVEIYCSNSLIVSIKELQGMNNNRAVSLRRSNPKYELNITISEEQ
jgi:Protein of unknown function (DUF3261)